MQNWKREEEEKEDTDLDSSSADLGSKNVNLEIEVLKPEAEDHKCAMCVGQDQLYECLPGRYDQELNENLQQHKQVTELEHNNEKLKDLMAMMALATN